MKLAPSEKCRIPARKHYRQVSVDPLTGELRSTPSGAFSAMIARSLAPKENEIRELIVRLRTDFGWPRGLLAGN